MDLVQFPQGRAEGSPFSGDRGSQEETGRAHRCAKALLDHLHAQKLEIYRARADMMGDIVSRDPGYWETVRSLKAVFDPDNIIAPGRYNLSV